MIIDRLFVKNIRVALMNLKRITTVMMIIYLIIISNINMGCDICELCDFFPKVRGKLELELTDLPTDPNQIKHNSQIDPIILHDLLLPLPNSQQISQHLTDLST